MVIVYSIERDNVQERIADYMTDLMGIGFSGFRVDAAKHIQPDDMVAIFGKFKRNMGGNETNTIIKYILSVSLFFCYYCVLSLSLSLSLLTIYIYRNRISSR